MNSQTVHRLKPKRCPLRAWRVRTRWSSREAEGGAREGVEERNDILSASHHYRRRHHRPHHHHHHNDDHYHHRCRLRHHCHGYRRHHHPVLSDGRI